jgi:hypothetical protein
MRATLFVTLRLIGRWPRTAPAQVGNLRQFLDLVEELAAFKVVAGAADERLRRLFRKVCSAATAGVSSRAYAHHADQQFDLRPSPRQAGRREDFGVSFCTR